MKLEMQQRTFLMDEVARATKEQAEAEAALQQASTLPDELKSQITRLEDETRDLRRKFGVQGPEQRAMHDKALALPGPLYVSQCVGGVVEVGQEGGWSGFFLCVWRGAASLSPGWRAALLCRS